MTDEIRCPLCGSPAPEVLIFGINAELIGCDTCLTLVNPETWYRERADRSRGLRKGGED